MTIEEIQQEVIEEFEGFDDWMDKYCYQVVINKKYLSEDLKRDYAKSPVVLKPWDPMGTLA